MPRSPGYVRLDVSGQDGEKGSYGGTGAQGTGANGGDAGMMLGATARGVVCAHELHHIGHSGKPTLAQQ